ncbi:MAG: tetratricopeptide repeat protein [Hyalangium sp.]|uniref:CHAT domain-containing tetratricopeptide repeat protein n=1 Tax=Hyalangium sp. TaxID=2028555 RepID=UPI00389B36AB
MRQALVFVVMVAVVFRGAEGRADEATRPEVRLQPAQTAYDRAKALYEAGKYADAIAQGEMALREAVLGGRKPQLAERLDWLGVLYGLQGDYARAEPLLQRGLELRETVLGPNHPDVAQTLNHLANLYRGRGMYGRAEPLYSRAIAIQEAALGPNHPDVAQTLNSLARFYAEQGLYGRAEPLYERALDIVEAALGKAHPDVAMVLTSRAQLYAAQGLYDQARPLYERALVIVEAALGKNHPDVATSLNNLATFCLSQGEYARAGALSERALAIEEAVLGKDDSRLAISLNNLALAYAGQGLLSRAEPLYERALAIRQAALGRNHPSVAELLHNFALLRLAQHRRADALPLLMRAFAIPELLLRRKTLSFSESRLARFLEQLRADEDLLYALLRMQLDNPDVQRAALAAVLLRKGRSLEETAEISRAVYRSLSAQDRRAFEQLRSVRTQLATLSFQGDGSLSPRDYQRRLQELATQGDALEADLATRSASLRALTTLPPPEDMVDRVAAALPRDSALVEFVAYTDRALQRKSGAPSERLPGQLRYMALVLSDSGATCVSDLGSTEPIDRVASLLRSALARRDKEYLAPAQTLYRLVFQPLLMCLGDTHHVFLSPEGQLGLVPFATLHDGQQFLVDTYDFTYLTSGKDLLPRTQQIEPSSSVVVLADPDWSALPQASAETLEEAPELAERAPSLDQLFSTLRTNLSHRPWAPLPGSRKEAQAIQHMFPQAQLYLGPEATKERLLHVSAPGVLHIATHGFFLDETSPPEDSRAAVNFGGLGDDVLAPRPPDPLLRSGLVLAGAQAPAPEDSGAASHSLDSALVTALELAGLNLWGTQLVVLSACDTGRGDVRLGQGVYGLRRAFVAAGAETVVMSLWEVNDETTRELMEAYYRNLLAGQGRASALREAMRALRLTQPHPHYWAPFIALGQETPLRALAPGSSELPKR